MLTALLAIFLQLTGAPNRPAIVFFSRNSGATWKSWQVLNKGLRDKNHPAVCGG